MVDHPYGEADQCEQANRGLKGQLVHHSSHHVALGGSEEKSMGIGNDESIIFLYMHRSAFDFLDFMIQIFSPFSNPWIVIMDT